MVDIQKRIKEIEEEIRKTPYHKATERHIGILKAKAAKLREKALQRASIGSGGAGYAMPKSGDATVVLVGPPSVGKSTLLNALTNAKSKVADYDFTTLKVIPGMLELNKAHVQMLDVPGLVEGAAAGVGRGKEVLSVVRAADLILLMTDIDRISQLAKMKKELYDAGVRLNTESPSIKVKKRLRGGLVVTSSPLLKLSKATIKQIAKDLGYVNAEIIIEEEITQNALIDALLGNKLYIKALQVVNKFDLKKDFKFDQELGSNFAKRILISAKKKIGLDKLKKEIWKELDLIRIYLRNKEGEVDYEEPLIVKKGTTVKQAAMKISTELAEKIEEARIWGDKALYADQKVGLNYVLWDEAVVLFI